TGGYYLLQNGSKEVATENRAQLSRIVKVERGNLDLTVSANGVVQPIDRVEIKSKASGQIVALTFEEGQTVQKGELLIELDRTTAQNDYEQAKADLAVAESNLKQQENNHRRALELFEKSLISEQERDQANLEKVRAEAQLVKARANLSSADERLRDTRVLSPITGVILSRSVSRGQIISSGTLNVSGGTTLATIADMSEVYVETNVDEVDIGKVQVGQSARVVADAFPDDALNGEVIRISPLGKTQQNVTTFNVIVLVRNIGGRLKAGMSTSVDIEIFKRRNVLLLPTEALKDPRSEQGRALLASLGESQPTGEDSTKKDGIVKSGNLQDPDERRAQFMSMSPDEQQKFREQMRQRIQAMSPEERQRYFDQMRSQGGGFMRGDGGGRRQTQATQNNVARERIVEVNVGGAFVPRIVKVGANNYDVAEILEGVQEGDEVRITSISRAKLASEQFTERMRSMQGMPRVSTDGGGRR
ncbi:MAG: efflux RND transporter periplasmic adaptor subunit, partial [Ignavibacteriales bacterium]|nr:efflux RND transporter periplasmic adaptor subunit [Ignavibacteriales bacterium]